MGVGIGIGVGIGDWNGRGSRMCVAMYDCG
jgi:hypothetical protein